MVAQVNAPVNPPVNHPVNAQVNMSPMPESLDPLDDRLGETKEKIKVGRNKKSRTVQILIPCSQTRKARSELQDSLRKTNLSTLKNYLKQRRLVKVGSTAPTNLLRQIYENAKAYGDVINENKDALLHNYEKEEP
jgi:hypothetical protein